MGFVLYVTQSGIVLFAMGVAFGILCPCEAKDKGAEKILVSIKVRNETLRNVLERISKSSGYEITVTEAWAEKVLSVDLENVELEKALKRVILAIGNPSHLVLTHKVNRKKEIIICTDDSRSPIQAEVDIEVSQDNAPDRENREVASPEEAEGKRITRSEIERIMKQRGSHDPQVTEETFRKPGEVYPRLV